MDHALEVSSNEYWQDFYPSGKNLAQEQLFQSIDPPPPPPPPFLQEQQQSFIRRRLLDIEGMFGRETLRRRMDAVKKVSQTDCLFTTSVPTPTGGGTTAQGILFTVRPNATMDILTFEIDTQIGNENIPVSIYYKEGVFSGATSDPTQWTKLADTDAISTVGGDSGAVVPTSKFTPVTLTAGTQYAFYVHSGATSNLLRLRSANTLIGQEFMTDRLGLISLETGVSVDSKFPPSFNQPVHFSGRIHYRSMQLCEDVRTSSTVELQFAVNENPEEQVMSALSEAVRRSIDAIIILDVDLIQFDKYHGLEIVGAESNFMGRSEEKCPTEFDKCSNIFTRVTFLHLPTITSGELQLQIFENDDRIAESVITQSDFETEYVGPPVLRMDFVITLIGVPSGIRMNNLQRRYYETVTADFLDRKTELDVFTTTAMEEVDGNNRAEGRRTESLSLRGNKNERNLQNSGAIQIATTVNGASSNAAEFRAAILESLGLSRDEYVLDLVGQQLRPGKINEGNSGDMFSNIMGATVIVKPDDFNSIGETPGTNSSNGTETEEGNTLWVILSVVGMVLSAAWLAFRVYKDYIEKPDIKVDPMEQKSMLPPSRRPSFDGARSQSIERRPSFDGSRRHPLGRRPSADRLGQSEHIQRPRAMMMPNGSMNQSAHSRPSNLISQSERVGSREPPRRRMSNPDFARFPPPRSKSASDSINPTAHPSQATQAPNRRPPPRSKSATASLEPMAHQRIANPVSTRRPPSRASSTMSKREENDVSSIGGNSIRSAPDFLARKRPNKQANRESKEIVPKNRSDDSIKSAPAFVAKDKAPKKKKKVLKKKRDAFNTTAHSSAPDLNVERPGAKKKEATASSRKNPSAHHDEISTGSTRSHGVRSLPEIQNGKRIYEDFDNSSSEESDFENDDALSIQPISFSMKAKQALKSKQLPGSSHTQLHESISSVESDFEDFVVNLKVGDDKRREDPNMERSSETKLKVEPSEEKSVSSNSISTEEQATSDTTAVKNLKEESKAVKGKEKKKKKDKKKKTEDDTKSPKKSKKEKKKKKKKKTSRKKVQEEKKLKEKEDIQLNGREQDFSTRSKLSLRDMMKLNSADDSSSSSSSNESSCGELSARPIARLQFSEKEAKLSGNEVDDGSVISAITTSMHSSSTRNKSEASDASTLTKKRNRLSTVPVQKSPGISGISLKNTKNKDRSLKRDVTSSSPDKRSPKVSNVSSKLAKSPKIIPTLADSKMKKFGKIDMKHNTPTRAINSAGTVSTVISDSLNSEYMSEDIVSSFRRHLQDKSTKPVEISSLAMKPDYFNQIDQSDRSVVKRKSKSPTRGNVRRTSSGDMKLRPGWYSGNEIREPGESSEASTINIESKDLPPNAVVRRRSNEGLQAMANNIKTRNIAKSILNSEESPESKEAKADAKAMQRQRMERRLSSEALKLREISRGVQRSYSADGLSRSTRSNSKERDILRNSIRERLANDTGDKSHPKRWGELVRTVSQERLDFAPRTKSGQREAIASTLANILGKQE